MNGRKYIYRKFCSHNLNHNAPFSINLFRYSFSHMSTMNVCTHMDIKENKVIKRENCEKCQCFVCERERHVGVKRENHEPKTIQNRYYWKCKIYAVSVYAIKLTHGVRNEALVHVRDFPKTHIAFCSWILAINDGSRERERWWCEWD